jgi:hypothetical protein
MPATLTALRRFPQDACAARTNSVSDCSAEERAECEGRAREDGRHTCLEGAPGFDEDEPRDCDGRQHVAE